MIFFTIILLNEALVGLMFVIVGLLNKLKEVSDNNFSSVRDSWWLSAGITLGFISEPSIDQSHKKVIIFP